MTEEIINKDELKNLRFLLQSGQKLAISTKEFERVFDETDRLKQENKELKEYSKRMENQRENYYKEYNNYRSALEEILESAKFAQCLPCGSGNLEDCLNCNDDTTNNGQFCMEKEYTK